MFALFAMLLQPAQAGWQQLNWSGIVFGEQVLLRVHSRVGWPLSNGIEADFLLNIPDAGPSLHFHSDEHSALLTAAQSGCTAFASAAAEELGSWWWGLSSTQQANTCALYQGIAGVSGASIAYALLDAHQEVPAIAQQSSQVTHADLHGWMTAADTDCDDLAEEISADVGVTWWEQWAEEDHAAICRAIKAL